MKRNLNIKDIAAMAGVSHMTVSRVINNKPEVSEKTKRKIEEIIRHNDWRPDCQARGLVNAKSYLLGYITIDITSSFIPDILEAMHEAANQQRHALIVATTKRREELVIAAFKELIARKVDGIVLGIGSGDQIPEEVAAAIKTRGIRLISVYWPVAGVPLLTCDNEGAGRLAAEHLCRLGHEKCLFVYPYDTPIESEPYVKAHWRGFSSYASATFQVENLCQYPPGSGKLKARLAQGDITGVFCHNDRCVPEVYRAAWELNLNIPKDISVVGCNDERIAEMLTPRVTSIDVCKTRIGQEAVLRLILTRPGAAVKGRTFKPTLIIRESTARRN
jgi:LacI family transcriptional regulator